jgi:hypothetical protein
MASGSRLALARRREPLMSRRAGERSAASAKIKATFPSRPGGRFCDELPNAALSRLWSEIQGAFTRHCGRPT